MFRWPFSLKPARRFDLDFFFNLPIFFCSFTYLLLLLLSLYFCAERERRNNITTRFTFSGAIFFTLLIFLSVYAFFHCISLHFIRGWAIWQRCQTMVFIIETDMGLFHNWIRTPHAEPTPSTQSIGRIELIKDDLATLRGPPPFHEYI